MKMRLIAAGLTAFMLAGCETTTGTSLSTATASGAPQVKHFSYEGGDVSVSWGASSATLNYDAELALSNAEIASLISDETGCSVAGAGTPNLIGSRVHLSLPINCTRPASAEAA